MSRYFAFQWHITDECDQRCRHCYIYGEDSGLKPASMTWEQMMRAAENCFDFCDTYGRVPYFYITGGDPVLHPDFWRLTDYLKARNVAFAVMGNPFHLTDDVCTRLKSAGCESYQMSIDGMRETHDWLRKPGSFECTLEKIACIRNAGMDAVIMTTVSSRNIAEVPDIIDTVVDCGADVYAFARYCPTSEDRDVGISAEDYRLLLEKCDEKYRQYEASGCRTYFNRKDHLWTLLAYEKGEFEIPENAKPGMVYSGCNCGNCHLTILPQGDVLACRRVQNSKVGHVLVNRLTELWTGNMERYRDFEKFRKCSKCELAAWCRGCPAVANGTYGDFYAEDPQCWKKIDE